MLQLAIMNTLEKNNFLASKYKKEPNGNVRIVKYNNQNLKSSLDRLNGRIEMTEQRISEFENRTIEITPSEQQREDRVKKDNK